MGVTFCLLLSSPGARSASRGSSGTGGAPAWIPARPFGPSGMTSVKKGRAVIPAGQFDPGAVTGGVAGHVASEACGYHTGLQKNL